MKRFILLITFFVSLSLSAQPVRLEGGRLFLKGEPFLILELGPAEFLFQGTGCVATLKPADGKGRAGIQSIDEYDGLQPLRRLNGDEDHQGRHLRIPFGETGVQRLKVYRY